MSLPDSSILTKIQFAGHEDPGNSFFEKQYIGIRGMENRLYSDREVLLLPDIPPGHTHYFEWMLRKRSSEKLAAYLADKKKRLDILEVGCGNGWLSHGLSRIPGSNVTGIDINFTELQQAARVFHEAGHLRFIYGDLRSGVLQNRQFDIIVFASAIQYFRSLSGILNQCLNHLSTGGEIHIIDSPLYQPAEIAAARKRTADYYDSLGYPEMNDYYFHHDLNELQRFQHKLLRDPGSLMNRIRGKGGFYWVCIKK
ncbi:MAG TPA: class I SAM-dependent methyltransferase [Puia sp.]|nr:class I SAM-dependent methyltransferase [Puia sp.]